VGATTMSPINALTFLPLLLVVGSMMKPAFGDVDSFEWREVPWEKASYRATAPAPFGGVEVEVKIHKDDDSIVGISVLGDGRRVEFDQTLLSGLWIHGEPGLIIEDAALDALEKPQYISLSFEYGHPRQVDLCDEDFEPPEDLPCIVEVPRVVWFDVFISGEVRRRIDPLAAPNDASLD